MPENKRFENRTAFVTGAGKNIGREIALRFAQEGANVVVCDCNEKAALETAAEIEALGVGVLTAVCDVRDREKIFAAAEAAREKFGFVDSAASFAPALRVLDVLAENGGAIELNTSGWFKPCAEAYPSPAILREAAARRIPAVVSADAHHSDHVTRAFDRGRRLLREAGYPLA